MYKWNINCRFFNEKYACETLISEGYKSCKECKFASEYSKKILIIKFGALGDVIRTTPILEAIKKKYGEDILIYWLTLEECQNLLENNPYIDKVLIYNCENILRLQQEKFDILFSLEIDTPTTLLANIAKADKKFGFYFKDGATYCFNKNAEEYLETAFLTNVKLTNRKTYQEFIFSVCELPFKKEEPFLGLTEKENKYAEDFKKEKKLVNNKQIIGINFSTNKRWPSKAWSKERVITLIKRLHKKYQIILLGGKKEEVELSAILNKLKKEKIKIISNNTENTLREFAAIINLCDKIITTDTMAMHLALALKKPTIALFFSTPPWEIEGYGHVKFIKSPLLEKYFYSTRPSKELANSISVEEVLKALY